MNKAIRVVEIAWLAMAAYCIINMFIVPWGTREFTFLAIGAPVGIGMFFFRRWFRLRYERRQMEKDS